MNKIFQQVWLNRGLIVLAIAGIVFTYLLQDFEFLLGGISSKDAQFALRKILRVLLNDFFMLIFITAWFKDWNVIRLAILIQLVDGFILLPAYLWLKLALEGNSEISMPLLSQLHRLIVNPTLMILLIPAVYFQKMTRAK